VNTLANPLVCPDEYPGAHQVFCGGNRDQVSLVFLPTTTKEGISFMNCAEFRLFLQQGMGPEFEHKGPAVSEHFLTCEPCRQAAAPQEEEVAVTASA